MDTVQYVGRRPRAEVDSEPEVATARDLAASSWSLLDLEPALPGVRAAPRSIMVVVGPPGSGKSTLALLVARCSKHSVVLVSAEERLGAAVAERLVRTGLHLRRDVVVMGRSSVDDIVAQVRKHKARTVVIDSLQATQIVPGDIRSLVNVLQLDVAIVTSQTNKQNDIRGTRELEHEADIVVTLDSGSWTVTKTRYGVTGICGNVSTLGNTSNTPVEVSP